MRTIHDREAGSHLAQGAGGQGESRELLERRRDELERVIAAGGIGFCTLDPDLRLLSASCELKSGFGFGPDAQPQWSDLAARVEAEDRAALTHAVRAVFESGMDFDLTVRIAQENRWLALRGRLVCAADATRELLIITRDATAEKLSLLEQQQRLQQEHEQREAADSLNLSKDEFLSMLSHELRSPLNSILGWTRILSVRRPDDPEVSTITARVESAARAQLKMINDLLDLGRISKRKLKIEARPIGLRAVVAATIEAFRPTAAAKDVELVADIQACPGEVYGDADRLQQILSNLLSNAVKFTDARGRVTVTLRRVGNQFELSVADTGQGITPELLPHVFDRFRQADNSTTRRSRGLGLGLALAREIVKLHGGTITASSEGPDRGATFTVILPAIDSQPYEPRMLDGMPRETLSQSMLKGLSILVVDDEPDARAIVAEMLRMQGAEVTVTDSAGAAYQALGANGARFDVVVSDIGMPMEDGYSLVRKLRSMDIGDRVLAIALTGYASQRDKQAAFEAGFDAHMAKPVDLEGLVPMIRRLIPQTRHSRGGPRLDS